jgi:hypothetical protein
MDIWSIGNVFCLVFRGRTLEWGWIGWMVLG